MDAVDVDERIRALLRRGEVVDARAALVEEYGGKVLALCRAMVRDPSTAEDMKQDTFERAFASIDEHRGDASIAGWLLRIARNRCVDHLRRGKVVPVAAVDPDDPPDDEARAASDVVASLQRAELALAAIDPEDRALVLLHHVHGVEYKDLAESYASTEGALRMRMSRALAAMRSELDAIDRRGRSVRRRVVVERQTVWAAVLLAVFAIAGFGTYYGVIVPQREAQASLQRQLEELRRESLAAQLELQSAQQSGASEAALQRLRDQLAQAQANAQAIASGDTASIMRSARADGGTPRTRATATTAGGCTGPLCGLMR